MAHLVYWAAAVRSGFPTSWTRARNSKALRIKHTQLKRDFALPRKKWPAYVAAHHPLMARLHAHRGRLADWSDGNTSPAGAVYMGRLRIGRGGRNLAAQRLLARARAILAPAPRTDDGRTSLLALLSGTSPTLSRVAPAHATGGRCPSSRPVSQVTGRERRSNA
jgi:hypothetical protein